MPLVLDSLRNAVAALRAVQAKAEDSAFMAAQDEVTREAIRSGVIQHFEFTYELSWKFIKRWLEENIGRDSADGVSRRELFRMGAENRLVDNVAAWMRYHDARNVTSHTYDLSVAAKVYAVSLDFTHDAACPPACWLRWRRGMIDISPHVPTVASNILRQHVGHVVTPGRFIGAARPRERPHNA
jgi:nucleotidyltransferase substrate binding protein (TIGR01987 family)